MKREESLRSGPRFKLTLLQGERIEGRLVRCHYLLSEEDGPPIKAGFAISSRIFNAVQRNRLKRLLREAFTKEKSVVEEALHAAHRHASAVFMFRGSRSVPVRRMKLQTVRPDIAFLCRSLATKLRSM